MELKSGNTFSQTQGEKRLNTKSGEKLFLSAITTLVSSAVSEVENSTHITLKGTETASNAEPTFQTVSRCAMLVTKKLTIWRVSNAEPSDKGVD